MTDHRDDRAAELAYHERELARLRAEQAGLPHLGPQLRQVVEDQTAKGWTSSAPIELVHALLLDASDGGVHRVVVEGVRDQILTLTANLAPEAFDEPAVIQMLALRDGLLSVLEALVSSTPAAAWTRFEALGVLSRSRLI
jgi:hypothetical protein